MHIFITYKTLNLIKNLFSIFVILWFLGCNPDDNAEQITHKKEESTESDIFREHRKAQIAFPSGKILNVKLAITPIETAKGLSGIQDKDFDPYSGLLFFFKESGSRSFWMPDTYFNLDLIFLDKNLKVKDIARNVPHHPGKFEPIPRVRKVYARHVLEIKSSSPLALEFKIGYQLNWIGPVNWEKTQSSIMKLYRH